MGRIHPHVSRTSDGPFQGHRPAGYGGRSHCKQRLARASEELVRALGLCASCSAPLQARHTRTDLLVTYHIYSSLFS
jgi:hypothetical protein